MKRIYKGIIAVVALALLGTNAMSRVRPYQAKHSKDGFYTSISWCMPSNVASEYFSEGSAFNMHGYEIGYGTIGEMYKDYYGPTKSIGGISFEAGYKFCNWLSVACDVAAGFYWHEVFDGVNDMSRGNKTGVNLLLIPKVKVLYMDRPKVRLYGSLGIGASQKFGFDAISGSTLTPAYQITPIGVEYRVLDSGAFVLLEAGTGSLYTGLKAGFGIKF